MTETETEKVGDPLTSAIKSASESAKVETKEETIMDSPYLAIMKEVIRAALPEEGSEESERAKKIRDLINDNDFGCCRVPIAKMMALALDETIELDVKKPIQGGRVIYLSGRNQNSHDYGERTFVFCFSDGTAVRADGHIGNNIEVVDSNSDYYSRFATTEEVEQFISDLTEETIKHDNFLACLVSLIAYRTQHGYPVK